MKRDEEVIMGDLPHSRMDRDLLGKPKVREREGQDEGQLLSDTAIRLFDRRHQAPAVTVQQSPHATELCAVVQGGAEGRVMLWTLDNSLDRALAVLECDVRLTCGLWSPWQPTTFWAGK